MATSNQPARELRTPLAGPVNYVSGCGNWGCAEWLDISRTGACVRLGRYLRPGHRLTLEPRGHAVAIPATVVWCRRIAGTLQFQAGLVLDRRAPETALLVATLGYVARGANKPANNTVTTAGRTPDAAASALTPTAAARLGHAV